jgi:hypothetical protein
MSIFITGSSRFVGSYCQKYFQSESTRVLNQGHEIEIQGEKVVIHLAGRAHDKKNAASSRE